MFFAVAGVAFALVILAIALYDLRLSVKARRETDLRIRDAHNRVARLKSSSVWNSLGYLSVRVGQIDRRLGAIEETNERISKIPEKVEQLNTLVTQERDANDKVMAFQNQARQKLERLAYANADAIAELKKARPE